MNRSHLHTTFSFIKTRRSWGRTSRALHRVRAPGSAQRPERGSSLPSPGARECVHARVGRHTRPTVPGQLWGRIQSVCSEGGRACGEARSWHECEGERVPVRVPGPQARGEQSSRCLVRGAYARPSGRPGLVTVFWAKWQLLPALVAHRFGSSLLGSRRFPLGALGAGLPWRVLSQGS